MFVYTFHLLSKYVRKEGNARENMKTLPTFIIIIIIIINIFIFT